MTPSETILKIKDLFNQFGGADYDGEPVSQAAHMIQCGMLALEESGDTELVIGALLHDIGHLLKHTQSTEAMGDFGVVDHEGLGAQFLLEHGFSARICAVVAGHVAAKRYLVATDPNYKAKLSPASLETLRWQGGAMAPGEVDLFRNHPFFEDIISVRLWDERAKEADLQLVPLAFFETLIMEHLTIQQNEYAASHNTRSF